MAAAGSLAAGREARRGAGRRMRDLGGGEAEADEDFWGQDFFAESESDGDFSDSGTSGVVEDEFDSDFGASEDEEDEGEEFGVR